MTLKPWMPLLGLVSLTLFGLIWWIVQPVDTPVIEPALTVTSQSMRSKSAAIAGGGVHRCGELYRQLLVINEQAASLAGYPAIVEARQRQAAARQAARQIAGLAGQVRQIAATEAGLFYIQRQTAILKQIKVALDAYANGEGSEALYTASAANDTLRKELETLLGNALPGNLPDTNNQMEE